MVIRQRSNSENHKNIKTNDPKQLTTAKHYFSQNRIEFLDQDRGQNGQYSCLLTINTPKSKVMFIKHQQIDGN